MSQEKVLIAVGNIIRSNTGTLYRVIGLDEYFLIVIEMETEKTRIQTIKMAEVISNLKNGDFSIQISEAQPLIEYEKLSEKDQKEYDRRNNMVHEFDTAFRPYFIGYQRSGDKISEIYKKYGFSKPSFWRIVRRYYQSGCSDYYLLDHRLKGYSNTSKAYEYKAHPGRKGIYHNYECSLCDEVRQQFDEGVAELLSGKRATSIKDAYNHLIQNYYTEYTTEGNVLLTKEQPVEKIPTYKQFYLYFCAHTTKEQRDTVKTSAAEVRNSKRLLLSDSMYGVVGIGDMVEVDACEVDVSIVDTDNPEITVGRPILYCMIDVVSRVILAVSVAFENNSILGVTNLLMNLADDKAEYCRLHGVVLTNPDYWPSNIIPRRIRFDRGAECTSHKLETVLNRLHIERELVSAATGSLKGNIEQSFHQLHLSQNSALEDHGLIEKRHDSKHHKEATLDIHQYTKMVIIFVLSHNKMSIKGYPMSKELINAGVHPIPIELWKFYQSEYGLPRPITGNQKTQFVFDLMQDATATISRDGIRFTGHLYINEDDQDLLTAMYDAGTLRKQFPIRFDPRNMNEVFYIRDCKLFAAHLNMKKALNAGFENMTYEEMKKYNDRQNALKNEASETSDALRRERLGMNESIVKTAEKPVYSSAKNMRSNREAAKQKDRVSNSLLGEISIDDANEEPAQLIKANASTIENGERNAKDLSKMTDDEIAVHMMRLGEKIQQ